MFFVVFILTLELFFEMTEDALRVARCRRVDEVFYWIGQHVVLNSWARKPLTGHSCQEI